MAGAGPWTARTARRGRLRAPRAWDTAAASGPAGTRGPVPERTAPGAYGAEVRATPSRPGAMGSRHMGHISGPSGNCTVRSVNAKPSRS